MRHDDQDEEQRRCGLCGKILRPYDSISVTDVGERCCRCFNEELAERLGVDFDNTPIAPIVVTDVDGVRHRFKIRSMLVPTGHAMYAREVRKPDARGGYRFEILGDFETDARDLFKRLRERIRQGLSVVNSRVTPRLSRPPPSPRRLDALIEEATVDAYGESEQATAFLTVLEEYLALPFGATVAGEAVIVETIDLRGTDELIAICRHRGKREKVRLLDVTLPVPRPKGAESFGLASRFESRPPRLQCSRHDVPRLCA